MSPSPPGPLGAPKSPPDHLFDLHIHTTRSHDSCISPGAAIARARELGLRGLAITDHDRLTVLRPPTDDIVLVLGAELSTDWGDLLALGISELPPAGAAVPELIDNIHAQGGVAVVPHPFAEASYAMNERVLEIIELIDGLEVTSPKASADNGRARRLAGQHRKARVGGSDAHHPEDIGRGLTACRSPTVEGLLAAIRVGTTEAYIRNLP